MNQDAMIRMAREAGLAPIYSACDEPGVRSAYEDWDEEIERFAALIAAAQREKVAHWMRNLGYATGHGDTIEDLLDHLGTQIAERLKVQVLMEREACAKVCEGIGDGNKWSDAHDCTAAIRARSKTWVG
jgi:phosphoserine phosphatase